MISETTTTSPGLLTLPRPLPLQAEELEILEVRDRLSIAQWAQRKRKISAKTTDLDGDWSHDITPFLVEIMESLSDLVTRQVTLMKCTQSGGTEVALNLIGWAIDEAPGPILCVMPTEVDMRRRAGTRIKFMFQSTPSLLGHLGGRLDNLNIGKETELDNLIMYLGWAGSGWAPGCLRSLLLQTTQPP